MEEEDADVVSLLRSGIGELEGRLLDPDRGRGAGCDSAGAPLTTPCEDESESDDETTHVVR